MYSVTNRINIKKGMAHKMAPNFTKPGPLQQFEGFIKVEVHVSTQFEEYDELSVMMFWENMEGFEAWKNSDAFKEAHKRPSDGPNPNSPVISSQIVVAEIVSTISK
ncbi:heme oxygenase [Lysinibacillus endophyticus]|uniref:heme oxygenase n=1 Tax=Ureibacillus endophyticus TaxID=1978490 RepID=UPI0031370535